MAVEFTVIKSTAVAPTLIEQLTTMMPLWFQNGGIVMWLLLLTSFLVTILTLERSFSWMSYKMKKEHFKINECFAALNKKDKEQAMLSCLNLNTPALNMLKHGIQALPFSPEEKMQSYAKDQVNLMSLGQPLLRTLVVISLMLGAFGSVLSLINSLDSLSLHDDVSLSQILAAISHALIASASGIFVSLLAFIPYRILENQTDKLHAHLQTTRSEFNYICQQKTLVTNHMSDIMAQQEASANSEDNTNQTVAEHSEMPYHYEFKEGSDEVSVSLHEEMQDLHKTSQSSLLEMYKEELSGTSKKKKIADDAPISLMQMYDSAVDEAQELYGINEVDLQEQQENAHLTEADNLQ